MKICTVGAGEGHDIYVAPPYVLLKGHNLNQVPLTNWLIDQSEASTVTVGGGRIYAGSATVDLTDLVIEARAIYGWAHRLDRKGPTSRLFWGPLLSSSLFSPDSSWQIVIQNHSSDLPYNRTFDPPLTDSWRECSVLAWLLKIVTSTSLEGNANRAVARACV